MKKINTKKVNRTASKLEKRNIPTDQIKKIEDGTNFRKNITILISSIFFITLFLYAILWCSNIILQKIILIISVSLFILVFLLHDKIYNIFLYSKLGSLSSDLVDSHLEDEYKEVIPLFKYDTYHIDYIKDLKKRAKFFAIISNEKVCIKIKYNEEKDYLNFETLEKLEFLDNYEFKESLK